MHPMKEKAMHGDDEDEGAVDGSGCTARGRAAHARRGVYAALADARTGRGGGAGAPHRRGDILGRH